MITRRTVLLGAGAALLPPAVLGQPSGKVAQVAMLWTTTRTAVQPLIDAIEEGLREHGWTPGKNIRLEHRFTGGEAERLADAAAETVALKPDAIVAPLSTGASAVRRLTGTIPIVVIASNDPVRVGLAASLNRPGGNVTGMTAGGPELAAKRLQLLRELAPASKRVGVLWNVEFPGTREARLAVDEAAPGLGMTIVDAGVRGPDDFAKAFAGLAGERIDALLVVPDNLTFLHRREIFAAAAARRWPAIYGVRQFCDDGGLVCYGIDLRAQYKRGARFVDRILRGASPADMPIEQPSTYNFVINLQTAKGLGLAVPQELLLRANEVIR